MSLNLDKVEWRRVRLGDVAVASKERVDPESGEVDRYIAGDHMDTDDLQLHRWGQIGDGYLGPAFHRRFRPGQVLYGSRRTYLRKLAVADFEGVTANTTFVIQSKDEGVLLQAFLPFIMTSEPFHAFAIRESRGSVNPYVNWSDIEQFEFDLPTFEEQRRIADLLWAVEAHQRALGRACAATGRAYANARTALLVEGAEGWQNATWSSDWLEHWTENLPQGWREETIGSVSRVRSGATPLRAEQKRYFDGGEIPWVKTLDLNEGVVFDTEECITRTAVDETSAKILPAGTLLIAMYGGFGQIGRTARLGVPAATNQAVSAVLELSEEVSPLFLQEAVQAARPAWRKVAASSRKDPNITKRDVENFHFPLPPLKQQETILGSLSVISEGTKSLLAEAKELRRIKAAILVDVFGEA